MGYLEKALQVGRHAADTGETPELSETLGASFKRALGEIREHYIPGLMEHIAKEHPDTQKRMDTAEETLETTWVKTREGFRTLGEFNEVVTVWKDIILSACHEHRTQRFTTCDRSDQSDRRQKSA